MLLDPFEAEAVDVLAASQRRQHRALTLDEADLSAECIRDNEDVAEQDRRIKRIAAKRLQRRLDCQFRGVAEAEEIRHVGPQPLVFRQIPARLAHKPARNA